jgi:hypothetical protein
LDRFSTFLAKLRRGLFVGRLFQVPEQKASEQWNRNSRAGYPRLAPAQSPLVT